MLLRNNHMTYAPDGGTNGAAAPAQGQSQIPNSGNAGDNNQQQQSGGENNTQDNDAFFKNMWDTSESNSGQDDSAQQTQQQQNVQQTQPGDVLKAHLEEINLGISIPEEVKIQLQNGDYAGLEALMKGSLEQTYKQALMTMNKTLNNKLKGAIDEAVKQATGRSNADMAIRQMNSELPFTTDPQVKPIAEASLERFMTQGLSLSEAIDKVGQSFSRITRLAVPELQKDTERFKSGAQDLGMNTGGNDTNPEEPNWEQILNDGV